MLMFNKLFQKTIRDKKKILINETINRQPIYTFILIVKS